MDGVSQDDVPVQGPWDGIDFTGHGSIPAVPLPAAYLETQEVRKMMTVNRFLHRAALAACAAVLAACSGGTGPALPAADGPTTGGGGQPNLNIPQQNFVVVQFDRNGDQNPDVVTLDPSKSPMEIVSALDGTAGDPVDVTQSVKGQPIDATLSEGLANYLKDSYEVGARTELDLRNVNGASVPVTVFE